MTPADGLLVELADTIKRLLDPVEAAKLEASVSRFLVAVDQETIERQKLDHPGQRYFIDGREVTRALYFEIQRDENNPRVGTPHASR